MNYMKTTAIGIIECEIVGSPIRIKGEGEK